MLRFFRQIRQRLLTNSRFGKYLLYAVGEILLVVIGILIALQVDNINEVKKDRKKELAYLQRFQNDLVLNLKEMDRLILTSDSVRMRIDSLLSVPMGEIPSLSNADFNRLARDATDYLIFQAAEATIEDLLGSGELDIIKDPVIREGIATWESRLLSIRYLEKDHKKAFNDLLEYYRAHSEIYKIVRGRLLFDEEVQKQLLEDPVYLNTLAYHAIPLQLLNSEYRTKKVEFRELLKSVEQEVARLQK
jgi:hypothetical protein